MEQVDLIIDASWIIPADPPGVVLQDHVVAVRAGRIAAIVHRDEAAAGYRADTVIERPRHALIPGLINTHTHAAMTLFRGMADDIPLETWLGEHIWPAEARWAGPDFVRDGTDLAICEMLRGGTTCFQDMYFFPDVVAQSAVDRHIRSVVGMIVIEQPSSWAQTTEEYFDKGLAVHDQYLGNPLVHTAFAPHAPYTVSNVSLERIRVLANELDTPIHIHLHETVGEISAAVQEYGQRPLARLDDMELVTPLLTAVHMTQINDDEIALCAERGVSIAHCPESNLKLASGFCPVDDMLVAGVNVALGTDSAASNNDLDMFGEMRTAALLGKGVAGRAGAVPAEQALAMATINGARALGLADEIGSIELGKSADLVCVDLSAPATQPVHHPISQLVYSASRDQVSDVWVTGQQVVAGARLVAGDEDDALERATAWRRRLEAGDD